MSYKWCAVPKCTNTSIKTPEKLFVSVPKNVEMRRKWLKLSRRDPNDIANSSTIFFCEDHFHMENDMANYYQHKMGFSRKIILKDKILPSKFDCQPDRIKRMRDAGTLRSAFVKVKRSELIKYFEDIHQYIITNDEPTVVEACTKELDRNFRAPKALKQQSKQQQEPDAIVEIATEDIPNSGQSEDNQVPEPSEITTIKRREKSTNVTRRWRKKKKGVSESSKKQPKPAVHRIRENREGKKNTLKLNRKIKEEFDLPDSQDDGILSIHTHVEIKQEDLEDAEAYAPNLSSSQTSTACGSPIRESHIENSDVYETENTMDVSAFKEEPGSPLSDVSINSDAVDSEQAIIIKLLNKMEMLYENEEILNRLRREISIYENKHEELISDIKYLQNKSNISTSPLS